MYHRAKWNRIPRQHREGDTIMEGTVGQKRSIIEGGDHSELPRKKQLVSQNDKENKLILAEAGSQPCQKQ